MTAFSDQITVFILTFNEQDNIARTLDKLRWAKEVLVIDSGSTDRTVELAASFANARVVTRTFDTFAAQCNFAHTLVTSPWVLSLDADYVMSDALIDEIEALEDDEALAGYRASFIYQIYDKQLSGTLYPPRTVLYRRSAAHYEDFGHTQIVQVNGTVRDLKAKIHHDDRKPLARWFLSQQRYARLEVDYLLSTPRDQLGFADKVRLNMSLAPILVPIHALIVKRCIFDGRAGWLYVLQRTLAETMMAIELIDRKLRR